MFIRKNKTGKIHGFLTRCPYVTPDLLFYDVQVETKQGYALDQVVIIRPTTKESEVQTRISSCGISGGQSGDGAGFLRILPLPLPILIPPTAPHYHRRCTISNKCSNFYPTAISRRHSPTLEAFYVMWSKLWSNDIHSCTEFEVLTVVRL
jgi:hypothetical protein